MRTLTITEAAHDLESVRTLLIRGNVPKAAARRAEGLLEEANPGVDLRRLRPGMVLLVPDAPEFRDDHSESVTGCLLSGLAVPLRLSMRALVKTLQRQAETERSEREEAARLLKLRKLLTAVAKEPAIQKNIEALRAGLAAESKKQQAYVSLLGEIEKQMEKDLQSLIKRFG